MEVTASGLDKNQRDTRSNERPKKKKKKGDGEPSFGKMN